MNYVLAFHMSHGVSLTDTVYGYNISGLAQPGYIPLKDPEQHSHSWYGLCLIGC